jgi:hypothetical protein
VSANDQLGHAARGSGPTLHMQLVDPTRVSASPPSGGSRCGSGVEPPPRSLRARHRRATGLVCRALGVSRAMIINRTRSGGGTVSGVYVGRSTSGDGLAVWSCLRWSTRRRARLCQRCRPPAAPVRRRQSRAVAERGRPQHPHRSADRPPRSPRRLHSNQTPTRVVIISRLPLTGARVLSLRAPRTTPSNAD